MSLVLGNNKAATFLAVFLVLTCVLISVLVIVPLAIFDAEKHVDYVGSMLASPNNLSLDGVIASGSQHQRLLSHCPSSILAIDALYDIATMITTTVSILLTGSW